MDPINNPTPTTPSPEPTAGPAPTPNPTTGGMTENNNLVTPSGTPGQVVAPVAPEAPVTSTAPEAPVTPTAPEMPGAAPINPIVQPGGTQPPINPVVRPTGLGVTDPIMMPEKPQAPDPVEEELKAPMRAAAPVPGSIGSAVSGPADALNDSATTPTENPFAATGVKSTPSVAFTDPAQQPDANAANAQPQAGMKKPNKTTLIALIAVAAVVIVALIIILVIQFIPPSGSGSGSNSGGSTADNKPYQENNSNNNGSNNNSTVDPTNRTYEEDEGVEQSDSSSYDSSIVCIAPYTDESGVAFDNTVTFGIIGNRISEVIVENGGVNSNNSINIASKLSSLSDQVDMEVLNGNGVQYLDENGTLLVSEDELAGRLAVSMRGSDSNNFECTVE